MWRQRAELLAKMAYSDLAVGDFWKAIILMDRQLYTINEIRPQIGDIEAHKRVLDALKDQAAAYSSLAQCLFLHSDYDGVLWLCDDATTKYGTNLREVFSSIRAAALTQLSRPDQKSSSCDENASSREYYDKIFGEGEWELSARSGVSRFLPYPFIPPQYLSRPHNVIEHSKQLFQDASANCQLSRSSVRKGDAACDTFGVFATCDIGPSEVLFEDVTAIAACDISACAPTTLPVQPVMGTRMRVCDNCFGVSDIAQAQLFSCTTLMNSCCLPRVLKPPSDVLVSIRYTLIVCFFGGNMSPVDHTDVVGTGPRGRGMHQAVG